MHRYGKRRRALPVLIDEQVANGFHFIYNYVEENNHVSIYLFSIPGIATFVRGVDAVWNVVRECALVVELQQPQRLRSTNLRKHIASTCQILSLKEEELEWLANHLGHDIKTHRNYYRLPHNSVELAKISKLLYLSTSGNLQILQGCSLDSIDAEGKHC